MAAREAKENKEKEHNEVKVEEIDEESVHVEKLNIKDKEGNDDTDFETEIILLQPETNIEIATKIFECVLILCQTRNIRNELKKMKIYNILRNYDIEMEMDDVNTIMADIVNFLQRDESNDSDNDCTSVDETVNESTTKLLN